MDEYETDPKIIIQRIKDEKDHQTILIDAYLKENEEILLNSKFGKIELLKRNISNNSSYKALRPCQDILKITDDIWNLMKMYVDKDIIIEKSFDNLYVFCVDHFNMEIEEKEKIRDLKVNLKKYEQTIEEKDIEIKEKEKEVEIVREEETDKRIAEKNIQEFLIRKAKKDESIKLAMERIKDKNITVWEKLKDITRKDDDLVALPEFSNQEWELRKKIYILKNKDVHTKDGIRKYNNKEVTHILKMNENKIGYIIKEFEAWKLNQIYMDKLRSIEIDEEALNLIVEKTTMQE